jgi:hypothetical protein
MLAPAPLDELPGFRRRFRITPAAGRICAEVEDDFHHMSVTVHHDGKRATAIEPKQPRAPWTTCPGAIEQLKESFTGIELAAFAAHGDKQANCTHLFDLALLAAAHAFEADPLVYDILVSDPVDGKRRAEIRRNGVSTLGWTEAGMQLVEPAGFAGFTLVKMRPLIDSLEPAQQEAARLLRWGNMIANGRTIPLERQSDATKMPPNCYTFQPHRAIVAKRIGTIIDFSGGGVEPLQHPMDAAVR